MKHNITQHHQPTTAEEKTQKNSASLYIHIPFCKQACHYCDFHFSTTMKNKPKMIAALSKEIQLRHQELKNYPIESIYFGGGTPSLLSPNEINLLINQIYKNYTINTPPEITLEANPDDLITNPNQTLKNLKETGINRLSIGIQSFFEEDLKLINRAHNATQALTVIQKATQYFENITADLIYGIPGLTNQKWLHNIQTLTNLNIPHISSYALTVEPKTALATLVKKGTIPEPDDEIAYQQFILLINELEKNNYQHYELSNFGKPGYFSKNNTGYWLGNKYIGIGPSAHSYNGTSRSWNIANNNLYLKAIHNNQLPSEIENLTITDRYNEYIMTGLRTIWGISLERIKTEFGQNYLNHLILNATPYLNNKKLEQINNTIKTTKTGKFLTDGITRNLFYTTS